MKIIELECWQRSAADPRRTEYVGQRTAQEVFEELKYQLESTGYLPDEYFLLDREWENGREIPKGADIFCITDYGASEGVYLDVYLKWYDEKQNKSITKTFITGKTLGENGNDLDRMFLISSAITKAFQGSHMGYSRFLQADGQKDTGGSVFHLSMAEQLLRRMTGSITAKPCIWRNCGRQSFPGFIKAHSTNRNSQNREKHSPYWRCHKNAGRSFISADNRMICSHFCHNITVIEKIDCLFPKCHYR